MREYKTVYTQKLKVELKKLTKKKVILKAVSDAPIYLEGLKPEEIYAVVLERIELGRGVLRTG